jgi:hypothetical protein
MATHEGKITVPTADEVPITSAMLAGVRTEILRRIDQAREDAKADNRRLDAKINVVCAESNANSYKIEVMRQDVVQLRSTVNAGRTELKSEISELRTEMQVSFHELKSAYHGMQASLARMETLMEEQNARNKIVLEGLASSLSRHEQAEARITALEDGFRKLATPAR